MGAGGHAGIMGKGNAVNQNRSIGQMNYDKAIFSENT